jgi:tripartite-type tricarboxylate transporter receptor subunit TctC
MRLRHCFAYAAAIALAMLLSPAASAQGALKGPELRERFINLSYEPTGTTPEQLRAIMVADTARWGPIIKASGFNGD